MRRGVAALAAILAALVLMTGVFGPNLLRERVARAAERALHRPVAIGSLALLPAWPPTVQARDVSVTGLGAVPRVQAQVEAASLLGGRPRVQRITLLRPSLMLQPNARGRLVLIPPHASTPVAGSAGVSRRPARPPQLVIQDGSLVLRDGRIGADVTMAVSGTVEGAAYDLALQGSVPPDTHLPWLTGAAITARAMGDTLAVDLTKAGVALRATLPIATIAARSGADMSLSLRAADERSLAALWNGAQAVAGPVSVDTHLTGDGTAFALHAIDVTAPQGDLSGDLSGVFGPHPSLHGTLRARRLDVDSMLAALAGAQAAPHAPAPAGAAPAGRASPWLIPDHPLPFARLGHADADLTLAVGTLRFGGVDYRDLTGHVVLHDGRLAVAPFAASLPGGAHMDASLHADAAAAPPAVALTLHAPAVALAPLLAAWHRPDTLSGMAAVQADLRARGDTLHALASTVDGTVSIRVTDGAIDSRVFADLLGAAHLPARLPPGQTPVRCAAAGAVAQGGTLQLAPLVADADRARIEGMGSVDLAQETLALQLRPLLRGGPGLMIPVRLTGPWRAPKVAIGQGGDLPAQTACPAAAGARKPPKPIDLLRSLLR